MLYSLHAINTKEDTVALAYYFTGSAVEADDSWELALNEETQDCWSAASTRCVSAIVQERPVVVFAKGDLVLLLAGDDVEDELSLAQHLQYLIIIMTAVCEEKLVPTQIVSFHGKVIQCLHESYPLGMRRNTNAESVLRAAKLKAVQV